jgi:hypothetical protein
VRQGDPPLPVAHLGLTPAHLLRGIAPTINRVFPAADQPQSAQFGQHVARIAACPAFDDQRAVAIA